MRIAMLAPRPSVRGPLPKHTPLLVDALRRLGCDVELLPWGRRVEDERLLAKLLGRARDVAFVRRAVVRDGFRVVVVKTAHDWLTLTRDLALLRVLPRGAVVVLQFHGSQSTRLVAPGSRAFKRATAMLLASATGVLVLSREEQADWQRFSPRSRVLVVRNPLPVPVANTPGRTSRNDGRFTILCVSRLIAEKGIFDLVRAMHLVQRGVPCRLSIAGDGPEFEQLQALAGALGVADSVEFLGYITSEELGKYYRTSDVFVLPTYWIEGFPTAILEAMAAGLPIVTTRTRGMADYLVEGENALFVPPRDPVALAASLTRLLSDRESLRRMGEANREKAREFDADPVAAEYFAALEQIVRATGERGLETNQWLRRA
jgi:glycosyltransferase involved in cell wall biosynthesis